ncbi:hypothetical protein GCM10022206_61140 [Streptomyces chiangmaiensis]
MDLAWLERKRNQLGALTRLVPPRLTAQGAPMPAQITAIRELFGPPLSPAPIPSTVDPHTVERAAGVVHGVQVEARHCTNDCDARGRVCSALPGSTAGGMAPRYLFRGSAMGPPAFGSGMTSLLDVHDPGGGVTGSEGTDGPLMRGLSTDFTGPEELSVTWMWQLGALAGRTKA